MVKGRLQGNRYSQNDMQENHATQKPIKICDSSIVVLRFWEFAPFWRRLTKWRSHLLTFLLRNIGAIKFHSSQKVWELFACGKMSRVDSNITIW